MFTFIREAFGELEHVVWPTPKETRKYMQFTVSIIIVMAIILAILGYAYRSGLISLRSITPHSTNITTDADNAPATQADLDKLLEQFQASGASLSGTETTLSGSNAELTLTPDSGATEPESIAPESGESAPTE